ncbi:MAG: hypothetical protein JHC34_00215 [Acidobacteria bacterium]|jgi:hypothetical protein|nr:hypothetical protein [Acidobacteriota bacterium]
MRPRKRQEWEAFLEELKEALDKMGISYRETGRIKSEGALCTVRGREILIVNRFLHPMDKAELLKREVRGRDNENIYLKPEVREFLGG